MTGTVHVLWHVAPLSPPQPHRHCGTCGRPQPFRCSGKVRLNANGRRLDAWLIYKCTVCDRTWNQPLLERARVATVPPEELSALQSSDAVWVQARAFDLAALRRHASAILLPTECSVTRHRTDPVPTDWSRIVLTIRVDWPTGQRLDRLLAQELRLSRSYLQALQGDGGLCVAEGPRHALKAPLTGPVVLHFDLARLQAAAGLALSRAFDLPMPGAG